MRMRLLICLIVAPLTALAQEPSKPANPAAVEHGKYLVENVALCGECHTPRDAGGNLLSNAPLGGAPVPVLPPRFANSKWALQAPPIAGLNGYTEQQGVRLLMEGTTADGRQPRPPMPRFRMSRADAEAVVAYLKTLTN
jgi:mono/diheme cytochrome c family protein